jgi:uracil-DNA glycosylase family 4
VDICGPKCHKHGITGYGDPSHKVMIIGIAPGAQEVREKRPLVGQSGKLLNTILEAAKWPREKTYCTNLICWYKNDPTPKEIEACSNRLMQELVEFKPKLVVTLGKLASEVIGGDELKRLRGVPYWNGNFYHLSTYHPAAVLRGGTYFIHPLVRDIAKIPIIMSWPDDGSVAQVNYTVVTDVDEQQAILNNLPRNAPVSLDIETSNVEEDVIDVFSDKLLCFSISTGLCTWVFPADNIHQLKWPLDVQWTFHNGIFDVQGLRRYLGTNLPIVEDTMLMSYALDERGSGIHSLKINAREYCGSGFYEESVKKYRNGKFDKLEKTKLWEYNAKDAAYTARLPSVFVPMMKEDGVYDLYKNLLLPAANTFVDLQYRGVYVDQKALRDVAIDWGPKLLQKQDALVEMAKECGWPGEINLRSHQQMSKLLYQIIGLPGGPSVDKKAMEALRGEHPIIEKIQEFNKLDHMFGSYVMGIMDDIKRDGRLHPQVNLHRTVTGRLSYSNPPVQTIPQPYVVGDEYGKPIRNMFAATNDDYVIVETDYEKVEVWIGCVLSGDQNLYADLTSGDFHRKVAATIFEKPYDEISSYERRQSKYVTFGIMYDREAPSLAVGELKCSVREAQTFLDNWRERYHTYVEWSNQTKEIAVRDGEVVVPYTGRKRRFKLFSPETLMESLRQAVNFPIQSLGSDCCLSTMIELHPLLKPLDSYILWLIHDALIFEVSKKHLLETILLIQDIQTKSRFPGIPGIPIEMKIGQRWSETKEVNLKESRAQGKVVYKE